MIQDCIEFNTKYPDCPVTFGVFMIGDGQCHLYPPFNTEECGWDGGDCVVKDYPKCKGVDPNWIGDGRCDNHAPFNTEECGWDGGDCPTPP